MEKVKIRRRIQNDFQNSIVTERVVSVGAFRKRPNNVFRFADKPGHIVIFTCRRKPFRIMMSAETYDKLTGQIIIKQLNEAVDV